MERLLLFGSGSFWAVWLPDWATELPLRLPVMTGGRKGSLTSKTTQNMQTQQVTLVQPAAPQPKCEDILYSSEKHGIVDRVVGQRFTFGKGQIGQWRKSLRAAGCTANEAKQQIALALANGEGNLRWAEFQVGVEVARAKGLVPVNFDIKAKVGVARFERKPDVHVPTERKGSKARIIAEQAETISGLEQRLMELEAALKAIAAK